MAIKTGTLALVGLGALAIYFIMRSKKAQAAIQQISGAQAAPSQPSYPGVLPDTTITEVVPGDLFLGIGEVPEIDPLLGPTEEQWDYWGAMAGAG